MLLLAGLLLAGLLRQVRLESQSLNLLRLLEVLGRGVGAASYLEELGVRDDVLGELEKRKKMNLSVFYSMRSVTADLTS